MARVLILSSWVARGHVGLSAGTPALQALGHTVTQIPTTLLSNHPGFARAAGAPVDPARIGAMIDALEENGWLTDQDAILFGYLPTRGHVTLAANLAARVRGTLRVVVDPVLGDVPKGLYIAEEAAEALRDRLLPLADVLTPNLFELGWLTGASLFTLAEARAAAETLLDPAREIMVTSAPVGPGATGVLRITPDKAQMFATPLRKGVPHGVGDMFSALIAAGQSAGTALGHLSALIDASLHAPHLRIAETAPLWTRAHPLIPTEI